MPLGKFSPRLLFSQPREKLSQVKLLPRRLLQEEKSQRRTRSLPLKGEGFQRSQGQIVVEYVLLLFISVIIATLITSLVVSRELGSDGNPKGFLIDKWKEIIKFIGEDYPE